MLCFAVLLFANASSMLADQFSEVGAVSIDKVGAVSFSEVGAVSVDKVTFGGQCTNAGDGDSAGIQITPRNSYLTVAFPFFKARYSPALPIVSTRSFCQASFQLNVPSDWSWAVSHLEFQSHVDISHSASVSQSTIFYFAGRSDQLSLSQSDFNTHQKDYKTDIEIRQNDLKWSDCGKAGLANIKNSYAILAAAGNLDMEAYGIGQGASTSVQVFRLKWKKCEAQGEQ